MIGFTLSQDLNILRAHHEKWIKNIRHLVQHLPKDLSEIDTDYETCMISAWHNSKGYIFQQMDSTQYLIRHIIVLHKEIHSHAQMILGLYAKQKDFKWYQKKKKKKILSDIENEFIILLDESELLLELFTLLENETQGVSYRELIDTLEST